MCLTLSVQARRDENFVEMWLLLLSLYCLQS